MNRFLEILGKEQVNPKKSAEEDGKEELKEETQVDSEKTEQKY